MTSYHLLHLAHTRLPTALLDLKHVSPASIFRFILSDSLLSTTGICKNTNSYTEEKRDATGIKGRGWSSLRVRNLKIGLRIVIYMRIFSALALEDYWKYDGLHPTHPITTYMSLNRFPQIKRYLHIAAFDIPKTTEPGKRLWHRKVDPMLNQLPSASHALPLPSFNISIDEAMIQYAGHFQDSYKMSSKPIELGFKFYCQAYHGYIWDFHPTSNQAGPDPVPVIQNITATGEIVMFIASKLPKRRTWQIYLENCYTSLPLLAVLKERLGIEACGTASPNSENFPKELAISKTSVGQLPYHYRSSMSIRDVGVLLWFDNRPVTIMTTMYCLIGEKSEISRKLKRPGRKSTNANRELAKCEENHKKEHQILVAINHYNLHMGGVDIAHEYWKPHSRSRTR